MSNPDNSISEQRAKLGETLLRDVQAMFAVEHIAYASTSERVSKDLYGGLPRRYGRRKLALSLDELQRHMDDRNRRKRAHRRMQVLAPVRRMLQIGMQQPGAFDINGDATRRLVDFLGGIEHRAFSGSPELEAVFDVVAKGPEFFKGVRGPVAGTVAAMKEPQRTKLRRGIKDALAKAKVALSAEEQEALNEALDLWVRS